MHDSSFPVLARNIVTQIGSQAALADIVGVSQQAVSVWCLKAKPIPAEHVLKVEAATGIPKEDLRPDIYPRDAGPFPAGVAARGAGGENGATRADPHPDSLSGLTA